MPLFYFDIQMGDLQRSIDEDGESHPDLDAARIKAGLGLCDVARDLLEAQVLISDINIWIRDGIGELMHIKLNFELKRLN